MSLLTLAFILNRNRLYYHHYLTEQYMQYTRTLSTNNLYHHLAGGVSNRCGAFARITRDCMESRAMEKSPQLFDVCIVCALPEEARAFLEAVEPHCEGIIEEHISPHYHYSYRFATL